MAGQREADVLFFSFFPPLFSPSLFSRRFIIAFYSNHLENLRFVVAISVKKKKREINKTKEEKNGVVSSGYRGYLGQCLVFDQRLFDRYCRILLD